MSKMTKKERCAMMNDLGKEHGCYIEFFGVDGVSWFASEIPVSEYQREKLIGIWREVLNELCDEEKEAAL